MKRIAPIALTLILGVASAHANGIFVKMTLSGTGTAPAPVNLQIPDTNTDEDTFGGNGPLGPFTFRNIEASTASPQHSNTCTGPTHLYFTSVAGAAVFRFADGSLLKVTLTDGADCIDLVAQEAHCTRNFQIAGGTGRFKNVSGGLLTLTETVRPVLTDASKNPVFFAATAELTGTIFGVSEDPSKDEAQ